MARYDAQQIIDNIERILEEEKVAVEGISDDAKPGRLRETRLRERERSFFRALDRDAFKRLRNFKDVDQVPEGTRFGRLKSTWMRFLKLVSARQAAFNHNSLDAMQSMANQIDLLQNRLRSLEDGQTRPAGMSMLEGSDSTRLAALVQQHLHGLHQNVDFISRNMGGVTNSLSQLLDNLSGLSTRLNQMGLRQSDFFSEVSAARADVTRIWTELGLVYESIDSRAEDLWKGLDERDQQLQLNTEAAQKLHSQSSSLSDQSRELKARLLVLTEQLTIHQELLEDLQGRLDAEAPRLHAQRLEAAKAAPAQIENAGSPSPVPAGDSPTPAAKSSHFLGEGSGNSLVQKQLDLAYLRFQRQFRADEEDLRERQQDYITLLDEHLIKHGEECPRVLDVACGDGIFLDLIREKGWEGHGVDINEAMVKQGASRGLSIQAEDAIEYLSGVEAKSFDAISAFQFVEHLPPFVLLKLLKSCYSALKPGGLLLIETINPHTLKSLHWFHLDLSHERLVFPEMLQLLAETAGLHMEEWQGINRVSEDDRLKEDGSSTDTQNLKKLNDFLFGDQDYYLLARRPGGDKKELKAEK